MKLVLAFLAVLTACTTRPQTVTDMSPMQTYRLPSSDEVWRIGGHLDSTHFRNEARQADVHRALHIQINGEEVIVGPISPMGDGELGGAYLDEHTVVATCQGVPKTQQ